MTNPSRRRFLWRLVSRSGLMAALAPPALALAQTAPAVGAPTDWPTRPISLLVGFAPGGGTDLIARQIAPRLSQLLGQSVVIENRAGGSGTIATGQAARARPDGYTLLLGHVSSNAMVPAITQVPYAPATAFTPILLIGSVPQVVVVRAAAPPRSLKDFIAWTRGKPGGVNYASSGAGTQQHFAAELFQQATGTTMTHVPYRGSGAALTDLLSGQVDVNFDTVPTVLQQIRSGQLRALAVTSRQRAASLPEVPTLIESGVPDYEIGAWYMLMGPAGLPPPVVERLAAAMRQTLATPEVRARLEQLGTEIRILGPADAQAYLRAEITRWARLAAAKHIKPD
ncbi:MAG: tripartite tricarboxylate transporter substrate binding protein [Mitsuaria chitosanitabida]|jgi:tripartite-type tricarboxylate transporter receptor subunit TctC|uniref:Bug family tripartite tricarboxylate transporter substrate binding protein n=1 Tax=Roseateles chitosanitabidus TaxID=65048 RepID=UPI001B08F4AA|nr:tripartite tricarboxylate transporter substrate binding protein [Roseateles chitosanitabidus]MBO9688570.1 tripartite tricarboxylate transporter substrate binding protein [Roseateles chitosanitabidus]